MAKSLSSRLHRCIDLFRIVRIWLLSAVLIAASAALLFFDKDGLVLGQSYAAIIGLVGLALAILNLPKQQQKKMIDSAKDAKDVFDTKRRRHEHDEHNI